MRPVHARAATGEERERLLDRFAASESTDVRAAMRLRSRETTVVVLEPGDASAHGGPADT